MKSPGQAMDPETIQRQAADPNASAWVDASAGAGRRGRRRAVPADRVGLRRRHADLSERPFAVALPDACGL